MAFTRWKYGVEHNRRADDDKSNGLRWLLVALGILLVVSFILARLFARQQPARIDAEDRPAAEPAEGSEVVTVRPIGTPSAPVPTSPTPAAPAQPARVAPPPPDPQATRDAAKLLDTVRQRPAAERVLLEKLATAGRSQRRLIVSMATTISP